MTHRSRYSLTGICSRRVLSSKTQNALLLASRELAREIDFEFIDQLRMLILTAASMTTGYSTTTFNRAVENLAAQREGAFPVG